MPYTRIIAGVVIAVVGLVWPRLARLGLGRLPRDISSSRRELTLYASVTTDILMNTVLSLTLWLFRDEGGSCGGLIGRSRYVPSSPEVAFATSVRKVIE
jgi:hypothetical protein